MGQQNTKSALTIKITSSESQTQQLFDFQSNRFRHDQAVLKNNSYLLNYGETVKILDYENLQTQQTSTPDSAKFKITQDSYQQIKIKYLGSQQNKALWRVISQGEAYSLKIGETLKIGKFKIKLKRLVYKKTQKIVQGVTAKYSTMDQLDDAKSIHSLKSDNYCCRICFENSSTKKDPLMCLCKCTGSIKHVHFLCLKDWITNKFKKVQDQDFNLYTYEQINCQLCKHPLSTSFKHEGKQYSFFERDFEPPYAQFESIEQENGKKKYSSYIINLTRDKQLSFGRNPTCDIALKDISISRVHCSFEYKQGMLLVRDKKSKFGTLVKLDGPIQFNSTGIQIQFESNLIQLYRKGIIKGFCCNYIDNYKLTYQNQITNKELFDKKFVMTVQNKFQITNQNLISNENDIQINPENMRTMIQTNIY